MTNSTARPVENLKEAKLPRRDWIVLPAVSLMTMFAMAVVAECIARRIFSESKTTLNSCLILTEASGVRGISNSVCVEKIPEGPLMTYKFDCSGFRTGMDCGPKPPGTYRIVMIGSSVAMGERVPMEGTVAALLPKELSHQAGRRLDLYNEAMGFGFPRNVALRFNDVLSAKPDLILWVLTPMDVKLAGFRYSENPSKGDAPRPVGSLKSSIKEKLREHLGHILTVFALRHLLYEHESQNQYVQAYLAAPDEDTPFSKADSGFLRNNPSPEWEAHLREFDAYATDIEARAKAAGVPLVASLVPNRAQAAMISMGQWPAGFDPYRLGRDLRTIITSHGGAYVDILPDFRTVPNPEHYYYPVDGHPDAGGHAIISAFLAKELSGAVPELRAAGQSQLALGQGR